MADPTDTRDTLGLTRLARTWARRLQQSVPGPQQDALVVLQGPPELIGHRFPLRREEARILLSRASTPAPDTIGLPSPYVSDPHAALEPTADGWRIVDLDSSNHTYVGTVRVTKRSLVYGDEIHLGDVVLVYVSGERETIPPHAVDRPSGLLARQVLMAEASALVAGQGRTGLLLLQVVGLRDLLTDGSAQVARDLGQLLLHRWSDRLLGRLDGETFVAVAADTDAGKLRREAGKLREDLLQRVERHGLDCRCAVLVAEVRDTGFPQLLACARAALQQAPRTSTVVDAELGAALLADRALLDTLLQHPALPLLLVAIDDEDHLRHHVGHDGLGALRWQLRRAVQRGAAQLGLPVAGVLDGRLFVLGLGDAVPADAAREAVEALFPLHRLVGVTPPEHQPQEHVALRRWLLRAVERTASAGPREHVDPLPTPVAAPYSLIWVAASDTARLKTVLDTAGVAARFLACISLAAVAASARRNPDLTAAVQRRRRRPLPTGEWVALLRELAPHIPSTGPIEDAIGRALGIDHRGVRLAHLLERRLLPARNRFAHAELATDEQRSAGVAAELLGHLNELLRSLSPLAELQLFTLLRSDPRRGGGSRATIRVHTGPRESFEVRQVDLRHTGPHFAGSCYLATLDYRHLLELSPLLRLHACPRCDREELFLAETLCGGGEPMELSAVSTGHRLRIALADEDVPDGLAGLLGK